MKAPLPALERFLCYCVTTLTLTSALHAQVYIFTDLGTLGGRVAFAEDINNSGQVVGQSEMVFSGFTSPRAFVSTGGTMTNLGTLPHTQSSALAINDSGIAVGHSYANSVTGFGYQNTAIVFSGGTISSLGTLGGEDSIAFHINNAGQIVGSSSTASELEHAFLYSGGTMVDLGTLGGAISQARGINELAQITGSSHTVSNNWHAFLYSDGTMTDLGTLGGTTSTGEAINDLGQVVGGSMIAGSNNSHAMLYSNGVMTDLGVLGGGANSYAYDINNAGTIVGSSWFETGSSSTHGFVYREGAMWNLNDITGGLGNFELIHATGINEIGQITGNARNTVTGDIHAYILAPTGEIPIASIPDSASSIAMVGAGLTGLALLRRRRADQASDQNK